MNVKYFLWSRTYSGRNRIANVKVSSTDIKAAVYEVQNFIGVYKLF